jgi:hypothetical protein
MRRLIFIAACFAAIIGCTEAGEGSDTTPDSTTTKDKVMDASGTPDTSSKDTASYERMPNKPPDSLKK